MTPKEKKEKKELIAKLKKVIKDVQNEKKLLLTRVNSCNFDIKRLKERVAEIEREIKKK